MFFQMFLRANAGKHQYFRRIKSTGAQHNFLSCTNFVHFVATASELNGTGNIALKFDVVDDGFSCNMQVVT